MKMKAVMILAAIVIVSTEVTRSSNHELNYLISFLYRMTLTSILIDSFFMCSNNLLGWIIHCVCISWNSYALNHLFLTVPLISLTVLFCTVHLSRAEPDSREMTSCPSTTSNCCLKFNKIP